MKITSIIYILNRGDVSMTCIDMSPAQNRDDLVKGVMNRWPDATLLSDVRILSFGRLVKKIESINLKEVHKDEAERSEQSCK